MSSSRDSQLSAEQCCRKSSLDFDRVEGEGERAEALVNHAVLLASKHAHTCQCVGGP